jgi:drug/metabolite transporter (DMT)-like permease
VNNTSSASTAQDRAALLKTRALIVAVIVGNVAGNALLSRGLHRPTSDLPTSFLHYVYAVANPWVIAGVVLLAGWMLANLSLLSRADLSYALPVTGSVSYMLIALVGHFFLDEPVSAAHWFGVVVITLGVVLVIETSPLTVAVHEAPEDER